MKRVLLGLLVLLVLAGVAFALSIDQLAGHAIERNASRVLGVDTRVGFVVLSPLSGELRVSSLAIDNPPGFTGRHFLTFDTFDLKTELRTLRSDVVQVPLFRLENIEVSLERNGDRSNTDAILANVKRFESTGAAKDEPAPKGPERRFVVSRLVIRDIDAHVEWNALAARESALDLKIPGIELENPGGARGLTLAELSNLVVKAVLESVRQSGQLPLAVASDLAGGLRGLARLPVSLTSDVLGEVGARLPVPAADAVDAVGGAVKNAGDAVERSFGGLFGGKDEEKR